MPKIFLSYLRVSTSKQGHDGLGIEAQREAVRRYVEQVGGELLDERIEVESGAVRDRPILQKLITDCRRLKATIIVARLDRIGRNVAFVSSLMEAKIEFVAVDAPFANALMLHILSAFAEHERTIIAERTRAALQAAKERGVVLGENGRRLAAKHRADAKTFAETLRGPLTTYLDQGASKLQDVADSLNLAGYRSREGRPWSAGTVSRILRRLDLRLNAPALIGPQ